MSEVVLDPTLTFPAQDLTMRGLKMDWRSQVYMPTVMDSAVLSLRKWLDGSAGPIPWPQVSPACCTRIFVTVL